VTTERAFLRTFVSEKYVPYVSYSKILLSLVTTRFECGFVGVVFVHFVVFVQDNSFHDLLGVSGWKVDEINLRFLNFHPISALNSQISQTHHVFFCLLW
jgi:hypothetical protein